MNPTDIPKTWDSWAHFRGSEGVHFFTEDRRFERLATWRGLGKQWGRVPAFYDWACGPDFSIYWDTPREVAAYQIWRARTVEEAWREVGVTVIPVAQWGGPQTWPEVGNGINGGPVVVRAPTVRDLPRWRKGWEVFQEKTKPELVIVFGVYERLKKLLEVESCGRKLRAGQNKPNQTGSRIAVKTRTTP